METSNYFVILIILYTQKSRVVKICCNMIQLEQIFLIRYFGGTLLLLYHPVVAKESLLNSLKMIGYVLSRRTYFWILWKVIFLRIFLSYPLAIM